MLYLPSNVEVAKGAGPSPYLPQVAYPLMVAGAVGIVVGLIGIVESHSRQAAGVGQTRRPGLRGTTRAMSGRVADAAALAGLVVAVAALLAASRIVVDVLEQAATMGDLHHALRAGLLSRADVHAELGEVVAGRKPGRCSSEETIVFDSTGMALQDVAAAAAVYERAVQAGRGLAMSLGE